MRPHAVDLVAIYGDDLRLCWNAAPDDAAPLAFSAAMREELGRLSIAIIGISGTGSVVAEQLLCMGIVVISQPKRQVADLQRQIAASARASKRA